MTAHEALDLIKKQLQKTEQNLQALKVLEDVVNEKTYTLKEAIDEVFGNEVEWKGEDK